MRAERWPQRKGLRSKQVPRFVSQRRDAVQWCTHPPASVNPCKGGGRIGKCRKRASKTGNSAENNRAEQRENRKSAVGVREPRDHRVLSLAACHGRLARFARPGRPTCPL